MKRVIFAISVLFLLAGCVGYDYTLTSSPPDHIHADAEGCDESLSPGGYCGNTMTYITANGEKKGFMGGDSVALTDLLLTLRYKEENVCSCGTEYIIDTEFGTGYLLNLSFGFVRCKDGQATLNEEQIETIKSIIKEHL